MNLLLTLCALTLGGGVNCYFVFSVWWKGRTPRCGTALERFRALAYHARHPCKGDAAASDKTRDLWWQVRSAIVLSGRRPTSDEVTLWREVVTETIPSEPNPVHPSALGAFATIRCWLEQCPHLGVALCADAYRNGIHLADARHGDEDAVRFLVAMATGRAAAVS